MLCLRHIHPRYKTDRIQTKQCKRKNNVKGQNMGILLLLLLIMIKLGWKPLEKKSAFSQYNQIILPVPHSATPQTMEFKYFTEVEKNQRLYTEIKWKHTDMCKIHYYNWTLSYWTCQRCILPIPVAPLNSPHSPELFLILQDVRGTFFSQFLWSNRNTKRIFSLSEFVTGQWDRLQLYQLNSDTKLQKRYRNIFQ